MTDATRLERARAFQSDLFTWTALHHFLSASLLRELAVATVQCCAPGHTFAELFDENLTGDGVTDTWSIVPRPVESEDLQFLQQHIRGLVWANDSNIYPQIVRDESAASFAQNLAAALRLGQLDFGAATQDFDRLQFPEGSGTIGLVRSLRAALPLAGGVEVELRTIASPLDHLQPPLQVLALKHLGDLCSDVDAWEEAAWFYMRAEENCDRVQSPAWTELSRYSKDLISQSRALTTWIIHGASVAAPQFSAVVEGRAAPTRLAILNGAHDALVVRMDADDRGAWRDLRSSTLLPPLLLETQNIGPAVRAWQGGEFEPAHRYFWSTLRRQIALGSYSDSRNTKALYGRALLAEVNSLQRHRVSPSTFALGARLLIEAGKSKGLDALSFSTAAVERYVSPELVRTLAVAADRHEGVRHMRSLALIELLAKWAEALPRDDEKLSRAVLGELIARTRSFDASFHGNKNIGGQGLKLLKRLATERPDLRRMFGDPVAELIVQKLNAAGWWTGESEALELAVAYVDVFEPEALRLVLVTALRTLQRATPEEAMWPITRPAVQLLASERALELAGGDAELSPDYMSSLLRYGVAQRSAGVNLLFALSRFRGDVPLSDEDRAVLQHVVDEVRAGARELNNGSVTDFIRAVLVGVAHAGRYAAAEAIDSLVAILRSAGDKRASIAFRYAYGPVLDLLDSQAELLAAGMPDDELRQRLVEVGDALVTAWTAILKRPDLLAGFSIPPEREPNPTLVYNWSFMSRRFLRLCGDESALAPLLERAAAAPLLSEAMYRASLNAAQLDRLEFGELDGIAVENVDAFYSAVGRRLHIARSAPAELQYALLEALLRRCLVLGPRELDVAIFIAATPLREMMKVQIAESDYLRQLVNNWTLRANLEPYLRVWLS